MNPNTPPPAQIQDGGLGSQEQAASQDTSDLGSVAVPILPGVALPAWADRMPLADQLLAAQQEQATSSAPTLGAAGISAAGAATGASIATLPPPDPNRRNEDAPGPVFYGDGETPAQVPVAAASLAPQWTPETFGADQVPVAAASLAPQWTPETFGADQATSQQNTSLAPEWTPETFGAHQATSQQNTSLAPEWTPEFAKAAADPATTWGFGAVDAKEQQAPSAPQWTAESLAPGPIWGSPAEPPTSTDGPVFPTQVAPNDLAPEPSEELGAQDAGQAWFTDLPGDTSEVSSTSDSATPFEYRQEPIAAPDDENPVE